MGSAFYSRFNDWLLVSALSSHSNIECFVFSDLDSGLILKREDHAKMLAVKADQAHLNISIIWVDLRRIELLSNKILKLQPIKKRT